MSFKLKQQREDVAYIIQPGIQTVDELNAIAGRYKRLILAYEAYLEHITFLYGPVYSVKEKRVIKDAEVGK